MGGSNILGQALQVGIQTLLARSDGITYIILPIKNGLQGILDGIAGTSSNKKTPSKCCR